MDFIRKINALTLILIFLFGCKDNQNEKTVDIQTVYKNQQNTRKYSTFETDFFASNTLSKDSMHLENNYLKFNENELLKFLDSIKNTPYKYSNIHNIKFDDSSYHHILNINQKLNDSLYSLLKNNAKKGIININLAKNIFPHLKNGLDYKNYQNEIKINFYPFDENASDFYYFAISIGNDDGIQYKNSLYFFKSDTVLEKHTINHGTGLNLNHFINEFNKLIVYFKIEYTRGSGIWYMRNKFFVYENSSLSPVLDITKNSNLSRPWTYRTYYLDAFILEENPLKVKYKYGCNFISENYDEYNFIIDSAIVHYHFNQQKNKYFPDFSNSDIDKILKTYNLNSNEFNYYKLYYDKIIKYLDTKDTMKKRALFWLLYNLKKVKQ